MRVWIEVCIIFAWFCIIIIDIITKVNEQNKVKHIRGYGFAAAILGGIAVAISIIIAFTTPEDTTIEKCPTCNAPLVETIYLIDDNKAMYSTHCMECGWDER